MDESERRSFALIIITTLLVYLIFEYYGSGTLFIPLKDDYYIKSVYVEFDKPFIRESIVFKINENKFHQIFKVYYGNFSDIVNYRCDGGLNSYFDFVNEGIEIGCQKSSGIQPGTYTITITYKPDVNWSYVKWIVFNYAPRKVEMIKSNGKLPYNSSLFGEPVVAFYPNVKSQDLSLMQTVKLLSWMPIIAPILFIVLLYVVYKLFGSEPSINERMPEVHHAIPSERTPLEVVTLFKEPVTTNLDTKIKEVVNTILAHGVINGAIDVKKDKIYIIDKKKFDELEDVEKEVILLIKDKKMSLKEVRKLRRILRNYAKRKMKEVYDEKGFWIIFGFSVLGLFVVMFAENALQSSEILRPFVKSISSSLLPPLYFISIISLFTVSAFKGHLFGRFKNKEVYKEFLLWRAFKNLLNDQSLIKKYGLKDKNMWGSWLVYAYALGVKKESIKQLIEIGKMYSPALYPRLARISGFSNYVWTTDFAYNVGKGKTGGFGGFSGGGTFGAR